MIAMEASTLRRLRTVLLSLDSWFVRRVSADYDLKRRFYAGEITEKRRTVQTGPKHERMLCRGRISAGWAQLLRSIFIASSAKAEMKCTARTGR